MTLPFDDKFLFFVKESVNLIVDKSLQQSNSLPGSESLIKAVEIIQSQFSLAENLLLHLIFSIMLVIFVIICSLELLF